jgi:hypothetical protein
MEHGGGVALFGEDLAKKVLSAGVLIAHQAEDERLPQYITAIRDQPNQQVHEVFPIVRAELQRARRVGHDAPQHSQTLRKAAGGKDLEKLRRRTNANLGWGHLSETLLF